MEKQKKSANLASFLARFLTGGARLQLVRFMHERRLGRSEIRFPFDPAMVHRVLLILPEEELDALHHIATVLSLRQFFGAAACSLLCTRRVADFFRILPDFKDILEYDKQDRFLFSNPFSVLDRQVRDSGFDTAVLLDRHPDLVILNTLAASRAAVRIGFEGSAGFPFLNCMVRPRDTWTYRTDRNFALARIVGAPVPKSIRWTVPKESLDEVRHVLREQNIGLENRLVGLDGIHLYTSFGAPWLEALIGRLHSLKGVATYCLADAGTDPDILLWLKQRNVGIVPPLSVPKAAALISLAVLQIAGDTALYQLAYLLQKPAIGLFAEKQLALSCRPSAVCRGVSYAENPDAKTIVTILEHAASLGLAGESGEPGK